MYTYMTNGNGGIRGFAFGGPLTFLTGFDWFVYRLLCCLLV